MNISLTRIVVLALIALFSTYSANAQQVNKCGTDERVTNMLFADPAARNSYMQLVEQARTIGDEGLRGGNGPRIIPVVFHVIHVGGAENISKEQIQDQIRVLNEDYTRTNADTVNTRDVFKPVAANPNINFRLAQLDPQGNCTEGIVRIFSAQTTNAGDNVKALSWWDNTKYLNIWVVKSISSDGSAGITLGFSSLPGFGGGANDGIVVRADVVGTIGNVSQQLGGTGRTLTHEIGHYLGELHTFQGGCSGGFFGEMVDDTPPVADASFGCDTTANTCHGDNPDLPDMIENYMDYANDECMNIFTIGQKEIMDATLSGSRSNLISNANLIATGTDGTSPVPCKPVADFYASSLMVCPTDHITFTDDSYNGTVDTRAWSFPTGNPTSSTSATPSIQFSTPGFHNVSLTVNNTQGSDSKTVNSYIYISPATAAYSNWQFFEGFENDNTNNEWLIFNEDNVSTTWQQVSGTSYSGTKCMKISNFSGNTTGAIDNLLLQSIDLTAINTPTLKFKVANAQKPGSNFTSASEDRLKVMISTNCGRTWQQRYTKSGANLSTVGTLNSAFTPTLQTQWREESVSLSSFSSQTKVLIRFEATSDKGNNLYIDDINISGAVGVEENSSEDFALQVYPNPSEDNIFVNFTLKTEEPVEVYLNDITGKNVATLLNSKLNKGAHSIVINKTDVNAAGVYFLKLKTSNSLIVRKIIFF